jgi:hypothetical protein
MGPRILIMSKLAPLLFPLLWLTWALYWSIQSRRAKS